MSARNRHQPWWLIDCKECGGLRRIDEAGECAYCAEDRQARREFYRRYPREFRVVLPSAKPLQ